LTSFREHALKLLSSEAFFALNSPTVVWRLGFPDPLTGAGNKERKKVGGEIKKKE